MARSFSSTIVEAINAPETSETFLVILKVKHSGFTNFRLVNNTENVTSGGQVYTAYPFSIVLPNDNEDAQPAFTVNIANADLLLVEKLRSIAGGSERVTCDVGVIVASDPDTMLAEWTDFEMTDVTYNSENMTFKLSIDWFMSEGFPAASFTPNNFPGIF